MAVLDVKGLTMSYADKQLYDCLLYTSRCV